MSASELCVVGICLASAVSASAADDPLPVGSAPAALSSGHFPDRVHEFVWRNWNAVPPAKLASILGCSAREVTALAVSMGLPAEPSVPAKMRQRGYVTLIRRNWHLLPYDQLLELLELTPDRLSVMLREDDFLWHKLGQLKPQCEPIRYHRPDDAARRRAAEIRRVVQQEFGNATGGPAEPRFDFIRQLRAPLPAQATPSTTEQARMLRFVYSYVAVYGDPLMNPDLDPYPDGLLDRLSRVGVNGVWLHALLRDLAPGGAAFPEFGQDHERRLANLKALVDRAGRFGIRVYLYFNEPRAMPHSFFEKRPEVVGVHEAELSALCTSSPVVRQWMADALAYVFREVPGLGGIYAITASENLTNCAAHGGWSECPRCRARSDTDIIAEVVGVLDEGVHRGSPQADVIVSDWGWKGHGDAREIIARLPRSVMLMSVSEWSKPIERGGIATEVGEYSISSVGPGPRALRHWETARLAGVRTAAEVQFNNTCELASLPYLPAMDLIAEHCHNLASVGLSGMLVGWTMGGYPSPNFELARRFDGTPVPDIDTALDEVARERFGPWGAPHARKAWALFSTAYREYPFHVSVVYTAPVQMGPANPVYAVKTGYRATMWGIPYDDLDGWRGPYPPDVLASQFARLAAGWEFGVHALEAAVRAAPPERQPEAEGDLRLARAAGVYFRSVANQIRFVMARDALASAEQPLAPEQRRQRQSEIRRCLESEIRLARQLFALTQEDSRIGFEPTCHYFYLPLDLVEKVISCRWLLDHWEGAGVE